MKSILAVLLALLLSQIEVPGADGAAQTHPVNIRIEMQIVAVPEDLAVPLVGDLMAKDKIEAAHAKIQDWLAKGTATLMAWPMVTTHSGYRAMFEASHELRYATSYDPPEIEAAPSLNASRDDPKVDLTQLESIPASFQTRLVGVTFQVEPTLSTDGRSIDLILDPIHTRLKGFKKVTVEKPSTGGKVVVEQPEFDVMKVTTSLTLRNGERVLMGVFRTDEPPKHLEFFLLKAEVIPME